MLIKLTSKCSMMCPHCMEDAQVTGTMMTHRQFCKPSVDCEGNVHMSESRLCPSVGNVNTDSFADIWQRMREFRPCGHCKQYRKFTESPRADIAAARAVMGL